jgi:hypothetical protein
MRPRAYWSSAKKDEANPQIEAINDFKVMNDSYQQNLPIKYYKVPPASHYLGSSGQSSKSLLKHQRTQN